MTVLASCAHGIAWDRRCWLCLRFDQPHCRQCGDAMERVQFTDGYHRSGKPVIRVAWRCPRDDGDGGLFREKTIFCMYPPPWASSAAREAYYVHHKPWHSVSEPNDPDWWLS